MIIIDDKGEEVWIPRVAATFEEAWEDTLLWGVCAMKTKNYEEKTKVANQRLV